MAGLMTGTVDAARGSIRSTRPESFDDFRPRGGHSSADVRPGPFYRVGELGSSAKFSAIRVSELFCSAPF
jgi:hypothetical protein